MSDETLNVFLAAMCLGIVIYMAVMAYVLWRDGR